MSLSTSVSKITIMSLSMRSSNSSVCFTYASTKRSHRRSSVRSGNSLVSVSLMHIQYFGIAGDIPANNQDTELVFQWLHV
jgi:hypothetical protein